MHAKGDWLLFVDADVELQPDVMGATIGWNYGRKLDLLSILPRFVSGTLSEGVLMPLAGAATSFISAAPPVLIEAVAGLALLGAFGGALLGAVSAAEDREAAVVTFLVTASGISFAGMRYKKRVIIVVPESAPQVKFRLTRSFGAEIRTYDIHTDHQTGQRDRLTRQIAEEEGAVQASPYDDNQVIAGNGVGGLEIVAELRRENRGLAHFLCQVSGGGLMAGHALAIADGFPAARIVGVEPEMANDFCQSLAAGRRVRLERGGIVVLAPQALSAIASLDEKAGAE